MKVQTSVKAGGITATGDGRTFAWHLDGSGSQR